MIDVDDNRLEVARRFGATAVVNSSDAVSTPRSRPSAFPRVDRDGGIIANVGVQGTTVALHLERPWDRNITITTRLVDTISPPMLLQQRRERSK